ncbi:MAG TPA: ribosomal RNA small subunit methyltransferase A [Deltaproteobacteria bacterium]|nr:ribosomal RNA small subunit methyltransferase A [Deltaproteobacteria bacterium]
MLKRSLSQNLLKDPNLLRKLVRLAGIGSDDVVVEIGSGQGDLTARLAEAAHLVYAVELDRTFEAYLARVQRDSGNVKLTLNDIMKVSLSELSGGHIVRVVGNIPYHLTGNILFKLLEEKDVVRDAHLTIQREVAERIASGPGSRDYGALSVIFQLYGSVKILLYLKAALFVPPPKVDSAFVSIVFKDRETVADPGLIDFVKLCFFYKRKYLRHSLERRYDRNVIGELFSRMGFDVSKRAEEIEPWLFREMFEFMEGKERIDG